MNGILYAVNSMFDDYSVMASVINPLDIMEKK
jgi:hypothetical protein